ncbi:MAG TPA: M23 family metallopeptidase [Pseudomonadota bacterium]|nr:M23 family metallopeptidase [Pseudomonadota bacterium]HQY35468.1 M23 family metallopeptidase [Pseudomonadota bacterium]HRA36390.1 M23 family metallopeptidase [Pseudomonadota bacterium]
MGRVARNLVAALALAAAASVAPAADCAVELPASATQGGLVAGRVARGCTVEFAGRSLRLAADGGFVFGLGRDAPPSVDVTVRDPGGRATVRSLAVAPRKWQVERVDGVPQSTVTPAPDIAARIAREQARVMQARLRDDAREDFRAGFAWPAQGRISGVYGSQRILNGTPKDPHYGLDIAAATGTPALAPAAGIVSFAAPDLYLTGGTVVIDHGHGLSSTFIHLSRVEVRVGERVAQGQRFGAIGMTGRASGPHLHWGMNWFDVRLDPGLVVQPPP